MNQDTAAYYSGKDVLVDANLLLLFVAGTVDRDLIGKNKRLKQYTTKHYELLVRCLKRFKRRITTPNIITEVSNLAGALNEPARTHFFDLLSKVVTDLTEEYIPTINVASLKEFNKLGVTDAVIVSLIKERFLLFTDDFRLAQYYASLNGEVINFNSLR